MNKFTFVSLFFFFKSILYACDPQTLRQHGIKNRHDSVIEMNPWGQEHFQKSLSVNTFRFTILKCRLKFCHIDKEPYVKMIQKHCCHLWSKALEQKAKSVLCSDESTFGKHEHRVLQTKKERDHLACYPHSVQKPTSLMVWWCIRAHGTGKFHILKETISDKMYLRVLEQHTFFFREGIAYFTMLDYVWHLLLHLLHGCIVDSSC